MAKHAHRLMFVDKKMWRCTLPGCSFFVHQGLSYILPGKQAVCWECGETFTLDEYALRDDMPKCHECRSGQKHEEFDIDKYMAEQLRKRQEERANIQPEEPEDELPNHSLEHSGECASWLGLDCDCKS